MRWLSRARDLSGRRKCNKFPEPLELYQNCSWYFYQLRTSLCSQSVNPMGCSCIIRFEGPSSARQNSKDLHASETRASSLSVSAELSIHRDIPPPILYRWSHMPCFHHSSATKRGDKEVSELRNNRPVTLFILSCKFVRFLGKCKWCWLF